MKQYRAKPTGGPLAIALVASLATIGVAQAQTTVITRAPATSGAAIAVAPLQLTPAQRHRIYRMVVHGSAAPAPGEVEYSIGSRVPSNVDLYAVPQSVVVEVPTLRPYKYMVVNGHVLLVDPATSQVVAELDD